MWAAPPKAIVTVKHRKQVKRKLKKLAAHAAKKYTSLRSIFQIRIFG